MRCMITSGSEEDKLWRTVEHRIVISFVIDHVDHREVDHSEHSTNDDCAIKTSSLHAAN